MKKLFLLLIAFLVFTPQAHAAISFDTSNKGAALGTTMTITIGSGTNEGAIAIVYYHDTLTGQADRVSAVTIGTCNMTKLEYLATQSVANDYSMSVWYCPNAPTGLQTVTPTISGGVIEMIFAGSYFGITQGTTDDNRTTATGITTDAIAPSLTGVAANTWMFLFSTNNNGGTAGANTTRRQGIGGLNVAIYDDSNQATNGSYTMNESGGGGTPWQYIMLSMAPAATAVTSTSILGLVKSLWIF